MIWLSIIITMRRKGCYFMRQNPIAQPLRLVFVQSFSSNLFHPILLDQVSLGQDWTKTGWTKINQTKSRSTLGNIAEIFEEIASTRVLIFYGSRAKFGIAITINLLSNRYDARRKFPVKFFPLNFTLLLNFTFYCFPSNFTYYESVE